ncbi:MAG: hypothetical protein K0S32_1578 [Bacteroidetes bacterium]|jgi:hypothetical protein|nr:hypothetical protein [Bacteroidota bacterium]
MKRLLLILLSLSYFVAYPQLTCNAGGDVFVLTSYDGGHLTIDVDMNIPGIKIGIKSYERTEVTIVGTYSANVDTIIIRGYNGGNNHCPPAFTTNTVIQAAAGTVKIYNNGSFSPYYNYTCSSLTNANTIISYFTNGAATRLRGYVGWYGCWCNPQKLSIAAAYCCKGAYNCFTALPLDLISFKAFHISQKENVIRWTTQNEYNFDRFEIYYSHNGEEFHKVCDMKSKDKNNLQTSYEFKHQPSTEAGIYYRLKMIDKDSEFKYSDVIYLEPGKHFLPFSIKNKIVNEKIEFMDVLQPCVVNLYSLNGTLIKSFSVSETETIFFISDLSPGIYMLKNAEGSVVEKIIK